jgi:hypothetical protein
MKVPEPFRQMALLMHQDVYLEVHSEDDLFEYLANIPQGSDRKVVVDFVDKLLASDLTHDELADIWAKAGADWILQNNSARPFFKRLREEIVSGGDG